MGSNQKKIVKWLLKIGVNTKPVARNTLRGKTKFSNSGEKSNRAIKIFSGEIFPTSAWERKILNLENKTKLNGNFVFKSNNLVKNYDTNIFEKININDLIFNSDPIISKNGLYNDYEFIIKNSNTDSQNSKNYKNEENHYVSGLFQFNSSLPLIKEDNKYQNILSPKLSLKMQR